MFSFYKSSIKSLQMNFTMYFLQHFWPKKNRKPCQPRSKLPMIEMNNGYLHLPLPQSCLEVSCVWMSVQYSTVQAVASVQTTHRMDAAPHHHRPRLLVLASAGDCCCLLPLYRGSANPCHDTKHNLSFSWHGASAASTPTLHNHIHTGGEVCWAKVKHIIVVLWHYFRHCFRYTPTMRK